MTPRMRTRDNAIALLRELDPGTGMSRNAIDQLIRKGKVPTVKIGNKVLLNFDTLLDVVANGIDDDNGDDWMQGKPTPGGIRRIPI